MNTSQDCTPAQPALRATSLVAWGLPELIKSNKLAAMGNLWKLHETCLSISRSIELY